MPPHPDRVRQNYRKCEIGDEPHFFVVIAGSDIAPFIQGNVRVTLERCINCAALKRTVYTHEEFKMRLSKNA